MIITPWNLGANATLSMRSLPDDHLLDQIVVAARVDHAASYTEEGCRLAYVLVLDPALTSIELARSVSDDGVVERSLTRADLEAGWTFL